MIRSRSPTLNSRNLSWRHTSYGSRWLSVKSPRTFQPMGSVTLANSSPRSRWCAALGDHQRPDRLHRAVPALGRAAGPAGLRGPGSADRVQRVGLALPTAILPVGAVHLHDPDAGCGDVAGQSGAVTAGPFDADQGDGPEAAQPAQQVAVAGRGSRELLDAEQPSDGIERGGDMHVGVGVHAAGDGACFFYDGHSHPFLRLRDGTHPLAVGPVNPGLLTRLGRSDRHRRWVPEKP